MASTISRLPTRTAYDQIGLPTGRIGLARMLFATTAADAYQATIAVTTPIQPPSPTSPAPALLPLKKPMNRRISVTSRVRKTRNTATLMRVLQKSMYVLKIANDRRNQPRSVLTSAAGTLPFRRRTIKVARDIQKAPYVENAVAPKVFPVLNSHMPAANWARPP